MVIRRSSSEGSIEVKNTGFRFPRIRPAMILALAVMLAGCDSTGELPESGFVTRYVMSWNVSENTPAERQVARYPDTACRQLAQTRASDAAMSQSSELTPSDQQKIFDFTYADCVKWQGR
jgi:hypothetical protein